MRILAGGKFVARDGGDTWPTPMDPPDGGLEWRLRYASEAQLVMDRFWAASIVSAYRALIALPEKRRNEVIRDIRAAASAEVCSIECLDREAIESEAYERDDE